MSLDSSSVFFKHNEEKVNNTIVKILPIGCLAGCCLIVCKVLNIFSEVNYSSLIIFTAVMMIISVVTTIISRKIISKSITKYILFLILEGLIAYLSLCDGLCLFLSYLIIPILACLYYDQRFSLITNICSYFVMIFTIVLRAVNSNDPDLTPLQWGLAYSLGLSIEYFMCIFIIRVLTKDTHDTLVGVYERNNQIKDIQQNLISGFANLVESKDSNTGHHIKRTSAYVKLLCDQLKHNKKYSDYLSDETIRRMVAAAPLHDLGKISIPDAILCKPKMLTAEEFNLIKQHTIIGDQLIRDNMNNIEDKEYISMAREMALHHHEWWNGNGYPDHLQGNDIPLSARIISTADVLDALLSTRSYKEPYSIVKSYDIMKSLSDIQFDPDIIDVLDSIKSDVEKIAADHTGQTALLYSAFD